MKKEMAKHKLLRQQKSESHRRKQSLIAGEAESKMREKEVDSAEPSVQPTDDHRPE